MFVEVNVRSPTDSARVSQRAMEAVGPVPDDEMIVVHGPASLRGVLDVGAGLFNVQAAVRDHFLREVDGDLYTKPDRHLVCWTTSSPSHGFSHDFGTEN